MVDLQLRWLGHAGFRFEAEKIVYIDPFHLQRASADADIVICSHDHYDHCSVEDIQKIITPNSILVCPADCLNKFKRLVVQNIVPIEPFQEITVKGVRISAIPAYNINKFRVPGQVFHPKENAWVGPIVDLGGKRIYHSGDTDKIPEMAQLKNIDLALMAVGGTYTMTWQEAVDAVQLFHPKKAIPMHYGSIVGSVEDAIAFKNAVVKHKIQSEVLSTFL